MAQGKIKIDDLHSSLQAELGGANTEVYNVVDYGANPNNTADDSAAIQAAIDAAFADGGGVVYFPLPRNPSGYHYVASGALITSMDGVNPNCQIAIPLHQESDGQIITIVLRGEVPPSFTTEGISGVPRNNKGVIIESTIQGTGSFPSVFGSSYYGSGIWGDRTFVKVVMENMIVRTSTIVSGSDVAGTMSAINFKRLYAFEPNEVKADISSSLGNSVSPELNNTVGIWYPSVNNKVELKTGNIMAEGYAHGVVPGEHFHATHVLVAGCVNGLTVENGYHSMSIQHFTAEVNVNNINLDGTGDLNIFNYETEHYSGSEWYAFENDIKKTTGNTAVKIFNSNVVLSFVGRVTDNSYFITDGSPDYKILFGCGENTLPATPDTTDPTLLSATVEDSTPTRVDLLFSEGMNATWSAYTAFGVTGHTVSAITRTGANTGYLTVDAFTAGEARTLSYTQPVSNKMQDLAANLLANITAASITNNVVGTSSIIFDDFDRANNALTIGNTVIPGTAWQAAIAPYTGTWGITSNRGYCVSETGTGGAVNEHTYVDAGTDTYTLTCDVELGASTAIGAVYFRMVDDANNLAVIIEASQVTLYNRSGGTGFAALAGPIATTTSNVGVSKTVTITVTPTTVGITWDVDTILAPATVLTAYGTATIVGIAVFSGVGKGGGVYFDNFEVV